MIALDILSDGFFAAIAGIGFGAISWVSTLPRLLCSGHWLSALAVCGSGGRCIVR